MSIRAHHENIKRRRDKQLLLENLENRLLLSSDPVISLPNGLDIILIDATVADVETITASVNSDAQFVMFDNDENPVEVLGRAVQISQQNDISVQSLSIISHGQSGSFQLGNQAISSDNLQELEGVLTELGKNFVSESAIYVYSCSVTKDGQTGQALIDGLAQISGSAVFASNDITGFKGDWDLETSSAGADWGLLSNQALATHNLSSWLGQLGNYTTNEDTAKTIDKGANTRFVNIVQPTHGTVVDNGDGTLTYTPDANWNGADSFSYEEYYYQYVAAAQTWSNAKTLAEAATYSGLNGYLATITSAAENTFITNNIIGGNDAWIGASDQNVEQEWRWVTGPEGAEAAGLGRYFYNEGTGLAIGGEYNNWNGGEPNNSGGAEDWCHIKGNGTWNDDSAVKTLGYVIEYDGPSVTDNITVNAVNDAPDLDNPIPDGAASISVPYSYTVPANTFSDVEGDTLTYSATKSNDTALPGWLSFNTSTREFSGTPTFGSNGTLSIKVTANDGNGGTTSDIFDVVINDYLIGYWTMDSTAVTDETGDHDSDVQTNLTSVSGVIGNSVDFNGTTSQLRIPSSGEINTTVVTQRSFSLWFQADATAGKQVLYREGGTSHGLAIYLDNTTIYAYFWSSSDITADSMSVTLPGGQLTDWHHVAFTFDGTGGSEKLYLDGALADSANQTGNIPSHTGNVVLGYSDNSFDYHDGESGAVNAFNGRIDDFRMFSVPLNATEVNDIFVQNPADMALDSTSADENSNGVVIGNLSVTEYNVNDTHTWSIASDPSGIFEISGTQLKLINGNSFNYETTDSYNLTLRVTDNTGLYYDEAVTVTVNDINDAPTAANSSVTTNEDSNYTFTAANFSFSDQDAGDSMTLVKIMTLPGAGTLTHTVNGAVNANDEISLADINAGKLIFTPVANANGTPYTTFTYKVKDSNATYSTASYTMTVNVDTVNDVPSFTKGANQSVNEDCGVQTVAGWATALSKGPANESAQTLSFNVSNNNNSLFSTQPAISSAGQLTYTPAANANGSTTVTVSISDNGGTLRGGVNTSATQTFTITVNAVNDVPSFTKGANQAVNEDATAQTVAGWATALSKGPTDEAGQTLSFNVSNDNNSLFSTQPAISSAGQLTYTPAANANGAATVTVSISDNGGTALGGVNTSANQTFTITVNAVNDVPSFTKGANQTVNEDCGVQTVAGWATALSKGPTNEAAQSLSFNVSNDNNALFSAQPAISSAGQLTYTPAADANGTTTVTVSISDNGGTALGGVDTSANQTFTITVNAVNDVPSFTKGADQTVNEDCGVWTVAGWATALSKGPTNEAAQSLSFNVSNDNNALFSAQPAISSAGQLTYTPAADANGTTTVTVSISDNGGTALGGVDTSANQTFTITVNAVNDVPSFTKGADQTVLEDAAAQTVAGWATALDKGPTDEAGQSLSFIVTNDNNALFSVQPAINPTGQLTYTLAPDANGTTTVSVQIADDGGTALGGVDTSAAQTFAINVTPVNDIPYYTLGPDITVNEDSGSLTFTNWASINAGAFNEGSQVLTIALQSERSYLFSQQPALAANGTLTFTVAPDVVGTTYVTVNVGDDAGTENDGVNFSLTYPFNITIVPTDDEPLSSDITISGTEDTTYTFSNQDFPFSDADGDTFDGIMLTSLPQSGTLYYEGSPITTYPTDYRDVSKLTYIPDTDEYGQGYASFTYYIKDSSDDYSTGRYTATFDIAAEQDPPTSQDYTFTMLEDSIHSFADYEFYYSDPDNDAFEKIRITQLPVAGKIYYQNQAISLNKDISITNIAELTYVPEPDANGDNYASFKYYVHDGTNFSTTSNTVTINVTPTNDKPAAQDSTVTLREDTPHSFSSDDFSFSDIDGDPLVLLQITQLPSQGTLQYQGQDVTANQYIPGVYMDRLVFTPDTDANGDSYADFVFRVSDGIVFADDEYTLNLNVTAVNDAPEFSISGPATSIEDSGLVTISNWLTSFSPGPADEADQQISFTISTDLAELFASPPQVNPETGELTFTIRDKVIGLASITITATDSGGTDNGGQNSTSIESYIEVDSNHDNDSPVLESNSTLTIFEDRQALITNDHLRVTDEEDAPSMITFTITSTPAYGQLLKNNVPLSLNDTFTQLDIDNQAITYQSNITEALVYADSFNFTVADSFCGRIGTRTFNINVIPVNDAAQITVPGTQTLLESGPLSISGISIHDEDAGDNKIQVTVSANCGHLTLHNTTGLTFVTGDGTEDNTCTFTGTQTQINNALTEIIYHCTASFGDSDIITVSVNDLNNTGSGGAKTSTATILVDVSIIDQRPEITDWTETAKLTPKGENSQISLTITETNTTDLTLHLYLDQNQNGLLEIDIDPLIVTQTNLTTGTINLDLSSENLPYGENHIIATLNNANGLVTRPTGITVPVTYTRILDADSPVNFTDSQGDSVKTTLKGSGSAIVHFYDTDNSDAVSIVVDGTDAKSSLTIKSSDRNNPTNVGDITINSGSIKSISAAGINLTGDLTVEGSLKKLTLGDVSDSSTITITGDPESDEAISIKLNHVEDLNLNSQQAIKKLKLIDWTDTDGIADSITAPSLGKISLKGETFDANITITGTDAENDFGGLKFKGDITGGTWTISGDCGKIAANSFSEDWTLNTSGSVKSITSKGDLAGNISAQSIDKIIVADSLTAQINVTGDEQSVNINKLQADQIINSDLSITGQVNSIKADLWQNSDLSAGSLNNMRIKGDFSGNITLNDSARETTLGSLKVDGAVETSHLHLAGNAESIDLGVFIDSQLLLGVKEGLPSIPTAADEFTTLTNLQNLRIGDGADNSIIENSSIAAWSIDRILLDITSTGQYHSLITADSIDSYTRQMPDEKVELSDLDLPGTFDLDSNLLLIVI